MISVGHLYLLLYFYLCSRVSKSIAAFEYGGKAPRMPGDDGTAARLELADGESTAVSIKFQKQQCQFPEGTGWGPLLALRRSNV
ncbi:hypothetical protein PENSPDRAFT_194021 [Peniophora sp. CONT]|nr:hypothetical protein PENSPDRAFT_194021 [Peniophora sp. CONT]